jgi:hypothetical protein
MVASRFAANVSEMGEAELNQLTLQNSVDVYV